jgi:hypothetical protein
LTGIPGASTLATMNAPPVWLLDIDGVLNAISTVANPDVWPADRWVRAEAACAGVRWPLLAARPVLDFVRRVHRAGRAEIRWHTTWQAEAAAVSRALGLPDFPVQPAPEFDSWQRQRLGGAAPVGATWWKLPAAERVVDDEGRALLWTDDDTEAQLGPVVEEVHPLYTRPDVLLVVPRTEVGLSPMDLLAIDAFLGQPRVGIALDEPVRARGRRRRSPAAHR